MEPKFTLIARLPGTWNVLVRNENGRLGFLHASLPVHFEECPESRLSSALSKYGYERVEPQVTLTETEIGPYLDTLEH